MKVGMPARVLTRAVIEDFWISVACSTSAPPSVPHGVLVVTYLGMCDLPGTSPATLAPSYPLIYCFIVKRNGVFPSPRRSTYGTWTLPPNKEVGICSGPPRISFWMSIVTSTGNGPAGNPLGKRVLSDVGSGTSL